MCNVTCLEGHSPNWHPDPVVTCVNGSWLGGECLPDPCLTDPPFANLNETATFCENTTSGDECSYSCDTFYVPNGNATCLNGQWLNDTRCVLLPCRNNPVGIEYMNFSSTDCALTGSGESCAVDCDEGYFPVGVAKCDMAQWNVSFVRCEEKPCGNFSIEFLDYDATYNHNDTECVNASAGYVCEYVCENGYGASTANSTCSLGEWSNASCDPLSCPEDPVVENLDHESTLCENTPHGSSCKVFCEGKFLSDASEATCSFGEWSEINCELPPTSSGSGVVIAGVAGGLAFLLLLLCCLLLFFFLRRRRKPNKTPETFQTVELSIQAQDTIQI